MRRIAVLGAGRVGSLVARDLAEDPQLAVLAADHSADALAALAGTRIEVRQVDLAQRAAVAALAREADVVVGAVPGAAGFAVLETVIAEGRALVDISFLPEDPLVLDATARRTGSCAVVDCGVAPGLSNWLAGASVAALDVAETLEIVVGGLPFERVWPFEYRAVFSPADVLEEYVRPARIREAGCEQVVPALSGLERIDFPVIGTLEAFYTDGLRTLLRTLEVPTMREKTLRWPGHAERMLLLREAGFLDVTPLSVGGKEVAPRAVAERLLARAWLLPAGAEEFTLLRVTVRGTRDGRPHEDVWTLFDRTDAARGVTSMARTTGYPCAIAARMLATGRWCEPGVHPPERLGREAELTGEMLDGLSRRGVRVERRQSAS